MDFKVSRKETVWQPDGPVEILKDNIFDLYPIYGNNIDPMIITDVEILDGEDEQLIDRAMFAVVKQRGIDPLDPDDGIPWAQAIMGEVPTPMILTMVERAVAEEGPGVSVTPFITHHGVSFKIEVQR